MRRSHLLDIWVLLAIAACLLTGACGREAGEVDSVDGPALAAAHSGGIRWETDWDAAFARARNDDRVVLVDVYADWCVWCRRLDSTTYRDERVASFVMAEMVPIKVNADRQGRRVDALGVSGLPTILVLSPDGRELGRIPGYLPAADFLEAIQGMVDRV